MVVVVVVVVCVSVCVCVCVSVKLQAAVYDILPLEEGAGKRCSEFAVFYVLLAFIFFFIMRAPTFCAR